jgi:hypothetical protein
MASVLRAYPHLAGAFAVDAVTSYGCAIGIRKHNLPVLFSLLLNGLDQGSA